MRRKPWIEISTGLALAGFSLLSATASRAADDAAHFLGSWQITFPYDGRTYTLVSVHDAGGYKNYVLLPDGSMPVGEGKFSAANGKWTAAADKPNDSGSYQVVDNNTILATNSSGQSATWIRYTSPLPAVIGTGAKYPAHVSATMAAVLAGARKQWKSDAVITHIDLQWYPPNVLDSAKAYWLKFQIYSPSIRSTCWVNIGGPINGNTFCGAPDTNPNVASSPALPASINYDLPDVLAMVRKAGWGGPLGSVELRMIGATGTPILPGWVIEVVGGPAWVPLFVSAADGKVVSWQRAMDPPNGNDAQLAEVYGRLLHRNQLGSNDAGYKAMECVVEIQETGNCAQ